MNEKEYFKKMIHDCAVNDAVVKAKAKMQTKKTAAWRRPLAIAAAAFAVLVGTVFLIPSARAEVMRWFTATRPEEYLTADPEERVPVDALNILIVPPATEVPEDSEKSTVPGSSDSVAPITNETPKATPVGSVTNNRIITVCDELIWQQIAADFSMELGESMFDGHSLYLSITMKGLCALPEIEPYIGGNATQMRIADDELASYFEDGIVPAAYQNEEVSAYEPMEGRLFLLLDDGSEVPFGPLYTLNIPWEELPVRHKNKGVLTDTERAEMSRALIEWLPGREIGGVMRKQGIDSDNDWFFRNGELVEETDMLAYLLSQADENGILSGTVLYRVGNDLTGAYKVRLEATLGTASFDLLAHKAIAQQLVESADGTVAWGAETVVISKVGVDFNGTDDDSDDRISLYKQLVSMEGVTMTAETDGAEISALGVHDVAIRIRMPDAWTQEDREALAESLTFRVLLNGEGGDWLVSPYNCTTEDDGSVLYMCEELVNVPYEKLASLHTVAFVPVFRSVKTVDMQTEDESGMHHESVGILDTECGKTTWSPYGVTGWNETFDRVEYPQYAITLTVR